MIKTLSFEKILEICIEDYYTKGKIFEIDEKDFYRYIDDTFNVNFNNEYLRFPLGPAAGPHTQLAQNILAAYLTGSRVFELKTVQVIDGKTMQDMISKPCIDVKNVGYNVEWSTELTVEDACSEYVKASILLQVISIELGLSNIKDFVFNISVGYDFEGITSKKISNFINNLKEAKNTEIFKECIDVIKRNIKLFKKFELGDINSISSNISNTITLSTMHGCKPSEILKIGTHFIENKKINLFIKCNPTLLGYESVREILDNLGYKDITIRKEDFDNDLKFDVAIDVISKLIKLGKENDVLVGVKLTNTLPVYNYRHVMKGESMYMSGKPLYPITIGVAAKFAEAFNGDIHISLSGGLDKNNALSILKTGIFPITLSTLLLKPKGYMNITDILDSIKNEHVTFEKINVEALKDLAESAKIDLNYKNDIERKLLDDTLKTFDCFKNKCGICADVCPNRANIKVYSEGFTAPYQIVHIENRCNECGNCHTFCPQGGFPYLKKTTLFADLEEFENSNNAGILKIEDNTFLLRDENNKEYKYDRNLKKVKLNDLENIEKIAETLLKDYSYLIVW